MRKLSWLLVAAVAALAAAGVAVAHGTEGKGIAVVSTSFTTKATSDTKTRSCTDASGAVWNVTHGTYTGTATGQLAGAVTIRTESVVNTTTGNGFTQGKLTLRDPSSSKLLGTASLDAVNTQSGTLNGLLRGRVPDGMLLANFSASLGSDGGTLNGDVGSGSAANSAIVYGGMPKCSQSTTTPPKPILRTQGKVTAVSSTSLTVQTERSTISLTVPSSLQSSVSALKVGDRVELTAARIDNAYVLVALKARH